MSKSTKWMIVFMCSVANPVLGLLVWALLRRDDPQADPE